MSLVVLVCVQEGIVLSADSRTLLGTGPADIALPASASILAEHAFKVQLLWGGVGVASCGLGHIAGIPVGTHLLQAAAARPRPETAAAAAEVLLQHLRSVSPNASIWLWVAAFQGTTPFVYDVRVAEGTIKRVAIADDGSAAPVFYFDRRGGRTEVEGAILNGLMSACPPVLERMTLKDAVDFSRHVVRTVIDQTRFGAGIAPVGGPVDTLVLTPLGPGWVALKVV